MANRNNSGRTKKSHNYRPYDTSKSFVKRITAKVSEILPQPTSWVSRWFSPAPKLNARERDEFDEDDDEEDERQPPSKRFCFSTGDTHHYSHQNNVNRLSDLERQSGELSPILANRIVDDGAIPGPSGVNLRHFVSSTPATQAEPVNTVRLREKARDDASDESESTSGCSSLVPGAERPHTRQEQHPATPTNPQSMNAGSMRRLSTSQTKPFPSRTNTSMNLSTSSQPTFDTYVFNNPLNRSGIYKKSICDNSCFYPGNTTFGGSSARLTPTVETRIVSVKASPTKQMSKDTIGTSAQRILRALEQFSTPVGDAKKIPMSAEVSSNARKRKAPQPYEELIYPSMPDLLRVKRREQQHALKAEAERNIAAQASLPNVPDLPSSSASLIKPPVTSFSQNPEVAPISKHSQYSLRLDNPKEKHIGSIKGRNKDEELEMEKVAEVNLPSVKLQITSLPKFDLTVPDNEQKLKPKPSEILPRTSSPPFKFSEPEIAKVKPITSITGRVSPPSKFPLEKRTFKFSEPLEPLQFSKKLSQALSKPSTNKPHLDTEANNPSIKDTSTKIVTSAQPLINFKFETKKASVPEFPSKSFTTSNKQTDSKWTCKDCDFKNNDNEAKCLSCGKEKSQLSNQSSHTWKCSKCNLANSSTENKCKSCGAEKNGTSIIKGFEGFKKPDNVWECKECFVQNKKSVDVCSACSTPKSDRLNSDVNKNMLDSKTSLKTNDLDAKASPRPLLNSFKAPEGSWECSVCLVRNKKEETKCLACSTSRPGAVTSEKVTPTFTFGIPTTSTSDSKAFQFGAVPKTDQTPQFTFGKTENKSSNGNLNFMFGKEEKKEPIVTTAISTVSSPTSLPLLANSIKKPEGSWECATCFVQNKKESTVCVACSGAKPGITNSIPPEKEKPTFSFGIPATNALTNNIQFGIGTNTDKTSNLNETPQYTFGQVSEDKTVSKPSVFNFSSNDKKTGNEFKPFSFMNSDQSKDGDNSKTPVANMFNFGNVGKENNNNEMNENTDGKPPKKRVSFGNPLTMEKTISNDTNSTAFGNLGHKANEISSSNFSFTPKLTFDSNEKKDPAPASNLFAFGGAANSSKTNEIVPSSEPTKPITFGSLPSQNLITPSSELSNSTNVFGSTIVGFKPPETENKPFSFLGNTQTSNHSSGFAFNPSTEFGSQPTQTPTPAPLFGQQQPANPAPPMFGQPQEQKPFVFGAAPAQQQSSIFTFNAPTQQTTSVLGSNAPPPAFSGYAAPTPKFDPNAKPSFNFTGGTTPSFSATSNSHDSNSDKRKMRKAYRRTTQHR